jgi:hypothetical protein
MDDDATILLYGYSDPHKRALNALIVLPTVYFRSVHDIDRDLTLTRLPCSIETARKWVNEIEKALGERFIKAEVREIS